MAAQDDPGTHALPVVVERTFDAPVETVWKAVTERNRMRDWFFDIKEFEPEVGVEFQFTGGTEERTYLHLCRVVEVVPLRKLRYSWRYDGFAGNSLVTFELFAEGKGTRVRVTHEGLETFPASNPDFAAENFLEGWTALLGSSLREYLETTGQDGSLTA